MYDFSVKDKIKENLSLYRKIVPYHHFLKCEIPNLIKFHAVNPTEFVVNKDKKLIYIVMPKVACSSITSALTGQSDVKDNYSIHESVSKLKNISVLDDVNSYFKFTVVRNPIERILSCYLSKYHGDKKYLDILRFDRYLLGYLRKDNGFKEFVRKIFHIPDWASDQHFKSQYSIIYEKGKSFADHIGRYEDDSLGIGEILRNYNLDDIPHLNRNNSFELYNYYDIETLDLLYRRYFLDFKYFNYELVYEKFRNDLKDRVNCS